MTMLKETLYFEFENWPDYGDNGIWTAQAEENGWRVFSPELRELGTILDDDTTYLVFSKPLGIRSARRKSVENAVFVIVAAWRRQQELKAQIARRQEIEN